MGCCGSDQSAVEPTSCPQQAYAQRPAYPLQFSPQQQQQQQLWQELPHNPLSPFLLRPAPNGLPWLEYVKTSTIFMDGATGMLAGPWGECICWAVHFEHSNDWQGMPEYASEGPVGGVLEAFRTAVAGRIDSQHLLDASETLETVAHANANAGQPLPLIHCCAHESCNLPGHMQPVVMQPAVVQPPVHGAPHQYQQYGAYEEHQQYQQYEAYNEPHTYSGGPTLLQHGQHGQHPGGMDDGKPSGGGMGVGGKMALAAAGGVAAGVGGYYLATHMDDVGEALGESAQYVGDAGAAAWGFAGEAAGEVEEFVEDMF